MKSIVLGFLILSTSIYSQGVKFFGEDIAFWLDREYFIVDGIYWFVNETDKQVEKIIYYPFPNDSGAGEVDSISIYNLSEGREEVALNISDDGLKYLLVIPHNDTTIYRIGYRQQVKHDCAKYILTSTKKWGRSLDWVKYKLIVDDKVEIKMFTYDADKLYKVENKKIYYWERKNFLPEDDFVICVRK